MTRVGRKAQRHLPTQAPLEFTCGEKHVPGLGAGDSLWVWGALQSSRAGAGPRETDRGQNRGAWMPLNSLDFTAGERHIQICLQKKKRLCCHCSE